MNICYLFICLFICLFGCTRSRLWHTGSLLQHVESSFLTRDRTQTPYMGAQSLSHWTTREVPICYFFDQSSMLPFGNNPTSSPEFELWIMGPCTGQVYDKFMRVGPIRVLFQDGWRWWKTGSLPFPRITSSEKNTCLDAQLAIRRRKPIREKTQEELRERERLECQHLMFFGLLGGIHGLPLWTTLLCYLFPGLCCSCWKSWDLIWFFLCFSLLLIWITFCNVNV